MCIRRGSGAYPATQELLPWHDPSGLHLTTSPAQESRYPSIATIDFPPPRQLPPVGHCEQRVLEPLTVSLVWYSRGHLTSIKAQLESAKNEWPDMFMNILSVEQSGRIAFPRSSQAKTSSSPPAARTLSLTLNGVAAIARGSESQDECGQSNFSGV